MLDNPAVAPPYITQPVDYPSQPPFLNTAVVGTIRLDAEEMIAVAKAIEWAAGRRTGMRFGPRPLDVDLLLLGDQVIYRPGIVLPHPRLRQRRFVLAPLADIAPGLRVPPDGATILQLLEDLADGETVVQTTWARNPNWSRGSH